jgi:succinate dehydrogenase/fumarate reductase flavoprotein subunit
MQRKGCNVDEKGLSYAVETMNIITVARLVASGARARTESRGPHLMFNKFGDLEPMRPYDEHWQQYVVIKNENDRISYTERKPVEP